jgi:hypothetical protein
MVFEIDPDKPDVPALARILSGMGMLTLVGSMISMLLAFSGYQWVNEAYAMAGAGAAFLLALLFVGQAKTLEMLAVVSARLKSRFALEGVMKAGPGAASLMPEKKPIAPAAVKERIIHVPDDQAREQGFKIR